MADIVTDPYAWNTTAGSNLPSGSTTIGGGLDDNLRAIQAGVKTAISGMTGVAGTNTITATAGNVAAYTAGQQFSFVPANTTTGAATLNVNSLGAKNIFFNGAALVSGEIRQNQPCLVFYDGTQFNLIGPFAGGAVPGAVTFSSTVNHGSVQPGDVATTSGVAATLFDASNYVGQGAYEFYFDDGNTTGGVGLLYRSASGSNLIAKLVGAAGTTLSLSGNNVQITQTTGSAQTYKVRVAPKFGV